MLQAQVVTQLKISYQDAAQDKVVGQQIDVGSCHSSPGPCLQLQWPYLCMQAAAWVALHGA